eukprot:Phypoly_transcript_05055.p1 GENE.Phypoly_transcript_05055~~Phypoly_transcript_05055.p1  ORF type:complete len:496 (+),score=53.36 Phypoly_transcript_05055:92-1579(+)
MARTLGSLLLVLALCSAVYAARSNVCLANTANGTPYKPLQLFHASDCPKDPNNCTSALYNYIPSTFMSHAPSQILPVANNRESLAYMTQDDDDNLDIVVITATKYQNNIIRVNVEVTGSPPAQILLKDDPTPDQWIWNPATNAGNFTWDLDAYFTDGVVLGHFESINCFRVNFLPNYNGAVATVSFLTGTVAKPQRIFSQALQNGKYYEFCQYPQAAITSTPASCSTLGTATATSLTSGTATYSWTDSTGAVVGTTSKVTGLEPGNYTVAVTVAGCVATRTVAVGHSGVPISATWSVTQPTKTKAGKIVLSISGGNPPYTITWKNSAGNTIASGVTTLSVSSAGTYTVIISDGCNSQQYDITVAAPGACLPGTFVDPDTGLCAGCAPGTYSNTTDAAACTVCPPGSFNSAKNATSCNKCAANTVSGGATGPCTTCPVSTSSPAGSGICTPCPPGTDRVSGATSCSPCDAGSFRCSMFFFPPLSPSFRFLYLKIIE